MRKQQTKQRKAGLRPWLLTALLLMVGAAQAQAPKVLSLKEALTYARQANRDARKARLDVENSEYRIDEVRSRALPQVNGSAALTHNPILQLTALPNIFGANPNPSQTILVAFGQKWGANGAISVSQALFDQSVLTGLKAARTTEEFYKLNAQLTEEQIIEQVATAYYQLLAQRQQVAVLDATIKTTQRVQGVLQGQYESGLAKKIDVDRIKVNLSNLTSQRQQLLNGVSLLENQLKFLMGMPIQTPITIPDVERGSIQPIAVAAAEQAGIDNRLELQVLRRQGELLQYQRDAYKAEYHPSLSLGGSYSYQGIGNRLPLFKGQSQGINWFDAATVSLNLRVPIFNGGATKSRLRQADVSIKKLQEDLANTELGLNLAYENARTQINTSVITLNQQAENVQLAKEVYSNTQNNYNNGLAPLTDLLNAETSLTEANNRYSEALLNYRVAEIQLIKSRGQLKTLLN